MSAATLGGTRASPVLTARIPEGRMRGMASRMGQSLPVGNEGAGVVVGCGSYPEAQALAGKTVAIFGGAMYSQHRCVKAARCLVLPADATPADGASCFIDPLTAPTFVADLTEGTAATGAKYLINPARTPAR